MSMKIIILEHALAHYRKDVFEKLINHPDFSIEIIGGEDFKGIKSLGKPYTSFPYKKTSFLGHEFYYLKGIINYISTKKPDVIICTGFDPHLIHTILLFIAHKIILSKKFIWWSHGTTGNQGRLGFIFRRFFYKNSDGVLVYSQKGRDNLRNMNVDTDNIKIVGNSLNNEDYGFLNLDLPTSAVNPHKKFTILFCGRITPSKKIDVLIQSLSILKINHQIDLKCIIIGGGDSSALKTLTKQLQLEDVVEFTGAKYGNETFPYFLNADLFVYPGGVGLSLLQAFSFGLPVITTDNLILHGPEIELLSPGKNGDLCKDEDTEDFARTILTWHKKIIENKLQIRVNCIESIKEKRYLPNDMYQTIIDFLNKKLIKHS